MRRDLNLIRTLMLEIEKLDIPANGAIGFYPGDGTLEIEGYDDDAVAHHLLWLIEGDYILGQMDQDGGFLLRRLTWSGCEFLDDVRDPEIWRKTREHAKSVVGVGFGFAWEIAKAELKAKLGLP